MIAICWLSCETIRPFCGHACHKCVLCTRASKPRSVFPSHPDRRLKCEQKGATIFRPSAGLGVIPFGGHQKIITS